MFEPTDVNSMEEVALLQHEYYRNLREAGFTKHEAWHIMQSQVDCTQKACHKSE